MSCLDFKQPHGLTEPVFSYGGQHIAEQCRVCHCVAATYGRCAYPSCTTYKGAGKLPVAKSFRGGRVLWFCSDDCKKNLQDMRRKESAAAKIAKETEAKKQAASR